MKKIIVLLLSFSMLIVLVSCRKPNNEIDSQLSNQSSSSKKENNLELDDSLERGNPNINYLKLKSRLERPFNQITSKEKLVPLLAALKNAQESAKKSQYVAEFSPSVNNNLSMTDDNIAASFFTAINKQNYSIVFEEIEVYGSDSSDVYQIIFKMLSNDKEDIYWFANYNFLVEQLRLSEPLGGFLGGYSANNTPHQDENSNISEDELSEFLTGGE